MTASLQKVLMHPQGLRSGLYAPPVPLLRHSLQNPVQYFKISLGALHERRPQKISKN